MTKLRNEDSQVDAAEDSQGDGLSAALAQIKGEEWPKRELFGDRPSPESPAAFVADAYTVAAFQEAKPSMPLQEEPWVPFQEEPPAPVQEEPPAPVQEEPPAPAQEEPPAPLQEPLAPLAAQPDVPGQELPNVDDKSDLAQEVGQKRAAAENPAGSSALKRMKSQAEIDVHRLNSAAWHQKWVKKGVPRIPAENAHAAEAVVAPVPSPARVESGGLNRARHEFIKKWIENCGMVKSEERRLAANHAWMNSDKRAEMMAALSGVQK